jgi:hypothetical protein
VASTYASEDDAQEYQFVDFLIATLFLIDWIVHFVQATHKVHYVISTMSIIDMLTIIPVYIEYIGSEETTNLTFFRMMRIFRVLRVLRVYKLLSNSRLKEGEERQAASAVDASGISRQMLILVITLCAMLFVCAGIVHTIVDLDDESFTILHTEFDFFAALYFMIVTSSTVGYGDIFPIKPFSRFITVILIIVIVYVIGDQLSKIAQLLENYSRYDCHYSLQDHVIVIGNYHYTSLLNFLEEFFHSDHGIVARDVLLVGENYPSSEMAAILENPLFDGKVKYLQEK